MVRVRPIVISLGFAAITVLALAWLVPNGDPTPADRARLVAPEGAQHRESDRRSDHGPRPQRQEVVTSQGPDHSDNGDWSAVIRAAARKAALSDLEQSIRRLRAELGRPVAIETLHDLYEDNHRRLDLRKYELMAKKVERGELRLLPADTPLPVDAKRNLYLLLREFVVDEAGRSVSGLVTVGPGEDHELDQIVRSTHQYALAAAEERAGMFNNLPFDERRRRAERIRTLQNSTTPEAIKEARELGADDWLRMDTRSFTMKMVDQGASIWAKW